MTVEAPTRESLQEGISQLTDKDTYAAYQARGGILPEERYNQASEIKNGILHVIDRSLKPTRLQAQSMASAAGIKFLPEEIISIYSFFRIQGLGGLGSANNTAKEEIDVWKLSDQRLLAEVLKMTGNIEKLNKFIAAFPRIFTP